jgi:hypothetical protein
MILSGLFRQFFSTDLTDIGRNCNVWWSLAIPRFLLDMAFEFVRDWDWDSRILFFLGIFFLLIIFVNSRDAYHDFFSRPFKIAVLCFYYPLTCRCCVRSGGLLFAFFIINVYLLFLNRFTWSWGFKSLNLESWDLGLALLGVAIRRDLSNRDIYLNLFLPIICLFELALIVFKFFQDPWLMLFWLFIKLNLFGLLYKVLNVFIANFWALWGTLNTHGWLQDLVLVLILILDIALKVSMLL